MTKSRGRVNLNIIMAEHRLTINTNELQESALLDLLNRLAASGQSVTASEYFEQVLGGALVALVEEFRLEDVTKVADALRGASDAEVAQVKTILRVAETRIEETI